jgi:hypothetical protein
LPAPKPSVRKVIEEVKVIDQPKPKAAPKPAPKGAAKPRPVFIQIIDLQLSLCLK